jgi:hypothetical protein
MELLNVLVGSSMSTSTIETSNMGGGGRSANSTAGFLEIVCLVPQRGWEEVRY